MLFKRWHTSRRLNPTSISTRVRCDAMSVQFPELPLASTQTLTMTPSPRPLRTTFRAARVSKRFFLPSRPRDIV
jgi:hypothetical protein